MSGAALPALGLPALGLPALGLPAPGLPALGLLLPAAAAVGSGIWRLAAGTAARRSARRRLQAILPAPPAEGAPGAARAGLRVAAVALAAVGAAGRASGSGAVVALVAGTVAGTVAVAVIGPGLRWLEGRVAPTSPPPTGLPAALDLLAACLVAGSPVQEALAETARGSPAAVAVPLATAAAGMRMGLPARLAWQEALGPSPPPALQSLARACVRSERGGTSLESVLTGLAAELRATAAVRAQEAARRAGVLAVLPLGLCFLPAYLLLGVVPAVAGLLARLR